MNSEAAELLEILTRSDLEGVCLAFDQILRKEKEKGTPFTTSIASNSLTTMTTSTATTNKMMTSNTILPTTTSMTTGMTGIPSAMTHFVDPLTGKNGMIKML